MSGKTRFQPTRRAGFTLVEIMIVVGIITLLAALAIPGFLRARKRAQASRVKDDLRLIEAAVDQFASKPRGSRARLYPSPIGPLI